MKTIMNTVFGSHLYGLSTPESDMDYKTIFIPESKELVLQKAPRNINHSTGGKDSKNTKDDVDTEFFALHEFIKLACDGETVALDMLHTTPDMLIETSEVWEFIQENRWRFYTTDMRSYVGYVRKQAAKYGVKGTRLDALQTSIDEANEALCLSNTYDGEIDINTVKLGDIIGYLPEDHYRKRVTDVKGEHEYHFYQVLEKKFQTTLRVTEYISILQGIYDSYGARAKQAQENKGIDWKALSHAIRGGYQLREIYTTGDLKYPLKDAEFLLQVKRGELDFTTQVKPVLEAIVAEVEALAIDLEESGKLPKKVDRTFWDNFVYRVYGGEIVTDWSNECAGKTVAEGIRTHKTCVHNFEDNENDLDWFEPTVICTKCGEVTPKSEQCEHEWKSTGISFGGDYEPVQCTKCGKSDCI